MEDIKGDNKEGEQQESDSVQRDTVSPPVTNVSHSQLRLYSICYITISESAVLSLFAIKAGYALPGCSVYGRTFL